MQNIIEICKELGIEIPDEKALTAKVSENYTTKAEHEKKIGKLETERDNWKDKAETAAETLKGFEGKDFDGIKAEAEKWKTEYDNLIQQQKDKAEQEELDNAISEAIKTAKGKNAKAIIANLDMDAIKASKNRDKDISKMLEDMAKADDTAFLFETDPEQRRAHFTGALGGNQGEGHKKLKDMSLDERLKLKKSDPELYKSLKE